MNKFWLAAGLAVFLAQGNLVSADEIKARDISDRIKELRERLTQFQTRDEEPKSEMMKTQEQDPEKLTEQLEHRQDAKVLVLFHDQGMNSAAVAPAQSIVEEQRDEAEDAAGKSESSPVEKALQKLRESRQARQTRMAKADILLARDKK